MTPLYKLGSDDAQANFGVTHNTPKPPAAWSQQWLNKRVKSVDKRLTIPSMSETKLAGFWREYGQHSRLNLGQAARDARWMFDHPDADSPLDAARIRLPSLAKNLFYSRIPPHLHHSKEELAPFEHTNAKDLFMYGYAPWNHKDPTSPNNR
jgi:hypothetical protein